MSAETQAPEVPPPATVTVIRRFGVQDPAALAMYAAMFDVVRAVRPLSGQEGNRNA